MHRERSARSVVADSLFLAAFVAAFAGCVRNEQGARTDLGARRIRVVTTVGMVTDLVRNIGGDRVEVTGLMGPGVDPHLYKASAGDVTRMQQTDLIFYVGLHLEGAMAKLLSHINGVTRSVAVSEGIDPGRLHADPGNRDLPDPHVWFDVSLWMEAARRVSATLEEVDPRHAANYRARASAYLQRLETLDAYVRARAAALPPERRVLVTAHDAFGYFGRAYGFEVHAIQGISTVTEAGTSDIQRLAEFIVARRVPAIFVETSVSPRAIEALQAAVQARGFRVAIGGELFSDSMGDPGTPEGTYEGMVRHNIDTIVNALADRPIP